MIKQLTYTTFLFCLFMGSHVFAKDFSVTANIRPPTISLGEAAQLEITIKGATSAERPLIPKIDGLTIQPVGSQNFQNVQIINGRMSVDAGVTHIYQIIPSKAGTFTIPGISVVIDSKTRATEPIVLTVQNSTHPPLPSTVQGAPSPSSIPGSPQSPQPVGSTSKAAMLKLSFPQRSYYVGETIPLIVKFYLNPQVKLVELTPPSFGGGSFTLPNLNFQPIQKTEIVDGVEYNVLEWKTSIGTIKEGDFDVVSNIKGVIGVPTRARRPAGMEGDFFDNFFNRGTANQDISLASDDQKIEVLPLPEQDKPRDFSGAIGSFKMDSTATPTTLVVGDPVTLKTVISGTGNFPQISAPKISSDKHFKTYTPGSKFEASSDSEITGKKTFEQIVIPTDPSVKELPPVNFSFFDPTQKKYITLSSPSVPLIVSSSGSTSSTSYQSANTPGKGTKEARLKKQDELVENKPLIGTTTHSLTPLSQENYYWIAQGVPLAVWGIFLGLYLRRHKLENDPDLIRKLSIGKALKEYLSQMDHAAAKSDTQSFFQAARRAIQQVISEEQKCNPDSITLDNLIHQEGLDAEYKQVLVEIFETADMVSYSGTSFDAKRLNEWKDRIHKAITEIRRHQ